MSNSLGKLFTVTSFGESHGAVVGVIVDGCPAGLPLTAADIQPDIDRRRPGLTPGSTPRAEKDRVEILSGTYHGFTTGAPVAMLIRNEDADSSAYLKNQHLLRPGHADFTARMKYGGFNDPRGGGRFSGRITAGFVMAGALARKLLVLRDIEVLAHTVAIGGVAAKPPSDFTDIRKRTEKSPLSCADPAAEKEMARLIERAAAEKDSLGGIVEGIAVNLPPELGEPVFDNLDGELAKALFAIPAVKGVEFGSGFAAARMRGSENNDPFTIQNGKIVTASNHAGGILGGISNGMPLVVRVAVKPTASIARPQETVNIAEMAPAEISVTGRHDVCIVPRAVPVVAAMLAITLCDLALRAGIIPRVVK
ncbi:MAG: chorismate synthase [Chloroflexota bacterium]